jgi:hypothetical protein
MRIKDSGIVGLLHRLSSGVDLSPFRSDSVGWRGWRGWGPYELRVKPCGCISCGSLALNRDGFELPGEVSEPLMGKGIRRAAAVRKARTPIKASFAQFFSFWTAQFGQSPSWIRIKPCTAPQKAFRRLDRFMA